MLHSNRAHVGLEIYLFGRFKVKVEGELIEQQRWKRRASAHLIKLLSLQTNRQMHREQIIDLLFADQDINTGINTLHKAIHEARRILEPSIAKGSDSKFLVTHKQQIFLQSPGGLFIDADEFQRHAVQAIKTENPAACRLALDLYVDDLLVEDVYEDWLSARRESLRLLYRKLVTKTAELYAEREEYHSSIELLNKLVLQDPTDEHVHQRLMKFLAFTGSKYQALKQFERCCAALRELGVEPERETVELAETIKVGKIPRQKVKNPENGAAPHPQTARPPQIRQLTFHRGGIQSAKFTRDEHIVYSAASELGNYEIYKIHKQGIDSVGTGLKGAGLFAVSPNGELALALNRKFLRGYISVATLAREQFSGASREPLFENVQWADWRPDAVRPNNSSEHEYLAIVRDAAGKNRLEYPIGNALFETGGWISHPQFLPDGKRIAFIAHPTLGDDGGEIIIVDLDGKTKTLSRSWVSIKGLACHKKNQEIWFTACREGNSRQIHALNLTSGEERLIYQGIGSFTLQDLSDENEALVTAEKTRIRIAVKREKDGQEKDFSWHDWSLVRDISADGRTILFTEAGESGGNLYSTYLRKTDGSPAVRLGAGSALAFSPDGKYALIRLISAPQRLALVPLETGETKLLEPLESPSYSYQPWACFFPCGKRLLFAANEGNSGTKLYVQDIAGKPRCLTPNEQGLEISSPHLISPDGRRVAVTDSANKICLYEIAAARRTFLLNTDADFLPVRWTADGRYLFIRKRGQIPCPVYRYDLASGSREHWLTLMPKDSSGVNEILRVLLTPDGKSYAYSYTHELSDLYIIKGLR